MKTQAESRDSHEATIHFTPRGRKWFILFVLFSIFGAWLNAQGGWVKDFSYHRVVVLPFLFRDFQTTGLQWYIAGVFDGLLGLAGNLIGIYGVKRLLPFSDIDRYRKAYFIIPLAIYLVTDFAAFINYHNYWVGITSIDLYGKYWNIFEYFIMVPSFVLTDILLILYRPALKK